jgi:hypothetical protein
MSMPDTFTELLQDELSPAPDPHFAAEMDEWVGAGFPRREQRTRRWRLRSPLALAGAGATVATACVAIGIALNNPDQATDQRTAGMPGELAHGEAGSGPNTRAAPADAAGASGDPGRAGIAPAEPARRIERSAQLTLGAPADEFQSVADRILQVTDRHDGVVLRSQVSTGDSPSGDFQLRIPGRELQPALRDLSALGDVKARSDTGQDVTREFVSVADSLQAARAERRGLLRRLATATDDARIQRLRDRLDRNARERSRLGVALRRLRERTNYAAVGVTLVEGKRNSGGGAGGTSQALDDSLGLLLGSFNWLLRALGVLIPAALVGGAAWWAARIIRRRRREAVLF